MLSEQINSKVMWKICIDLLSLKDQGVMEMADVIMGHHLYEFDTGHVFINSNADSKRRRILKPKEKIILKNNSIFQKNWIDDYYPNRDQRLQDFSLFNLMVHFDVSFF